MAATLRAAAPDLHREQVPDAGRLPGQVSWPRPSSLPQPADRAKPAAVLEPTSPSRSASRSSSSPTPRTRAWGSGPIRSSRTRRPCRPGQAGSWTSTSSRPWSRNIIEGREFNVAVMENKTVRGPARCRRSISRRCPESMPHICSYEAKWLKDHVLYKTTPPVCPAPIDDALRSEAPGRRPWPPSGPWAAGTTPGSISGWTEGEHLHPRGQSQSRYQPGRRLRPGPRRRGHRVYERFWKIMLDNALKRKKVP